MKRKILYSTLLVSLVSLCSSWGFLVHRTTQQIAIYQLPTPLQLFFYKHMDYLVKNATRPDERRSTDTTEATKHFIDVEAYGANALHTMPKKWEDAINMYTADSLRKYGYVTYHITELLVKLTQAFKSNNTNDILFYAADIGHYIQDAHVPLHTTINYDGQLTKQEGIHALWESVVPEIEISNYTLYTKHTAIYLKNPTKAIWKAAQEAHALLPDVLEKEKEVSKNFTDSTKYRIQIRRGKPVKYYTSAFAKAYAQALGNTINQQLLKSSHLTADIWYTAWVNAGKPSLNASITNEQLSKLQTELTNFKNNTLLTTGNLLAKKQVTEN